MLNFSFNYLIEKYQLLKNKYKEVSESKQPIKLFDNSDVVYKTLIGFIDESDFEIFVDSKIKENKVKSILKEIDKEDIKIEIVKEKITEKFDLKQQLEKIEERKIWLKCGGFITIDHTEALTAIDVNSGKFVGNKNNTKDESVFIVNKEATIEIARQVELLL